MLEEKAEGFRQQSKSLETENMRSETLIETLKNSNDFCDCIITSLSLLNTNEEMKF